MAVADVFTALSEDRPYRKGMPRAQVAATLRRMAAEGALDSGLVALLEREYESVDAARRMAQEDAEREYRVLAPCPSSDARGTVVPPPAAVAGSG